MARHRPNRRAVKIHRNYVVEEAALTLGVSKGTILRWLKGGGLPAIRDRKPFLILGTDLLEFLKERTAPKHSCKPNEFFCFRCRVPRRAAAQMIEYWPRTAQSGQLSAMCEVCETMMNKNFSRSKLPVLEAVADVSFPQGHSCLSKMQSPCENDHFPKEQ